MIIKKIKEKFGLSKKSKKEVVKPKPVVVPKPIVMPAGVTYIEDRGHYRYTVYGEVNYPKGKIIKTHTDLDELIKFINEQ